MYAYYRRYVCAFLACVCMAHVDEIMGMFRVASRIAHQRSGLHMRSITQVSVADTADKVQLFVLNQHKELLLKKDTRTNKLSPFACSIADSPVSALAAVHYIAHSYVGLKASPELFHELATRICCETGERTASFGVQMLYDVKLQDEVTDGSYQLTAWPRDYFDTIAQSRYWDNPDDMDVALQAYALGVYGHEFGCW